MRIGVVNIRVNIIYVNTFFYQNFLIKVCSNGVDWSCKIAGSPLKESYLNSSSHYSKEDVQCTSVGTMALFPFVDTDQIEKQLPLLPIFFTKKGLTWRVS